ncbi:MFS transporter [Metabacillus mangrovi]|nr:MFS transporter [Metabacillus mangrovi]
MNRKAALLLSSIGISNLGDWIYFIPLNFMVYHMTGSAAAVAALYVIRPLAALLTSFWAGSIVDRFSQRNLMIGLDLARASLVLIMLLSPPVPVLYFLVFIICMADAIYDPAASAFMVKLIPQEQRKVFNSYKSLAWSGAFILGPALAGLLYISGLPYLAFTVNAGSFLISALMLLMLPNLLGNTDGKNLSLAVLKEDWQIVLRFMRKAKYVMVIYLLFNGVMVMAAALDSQEAVFSLNVLQLSESTYGLLVSISGAGLLAGSIVNRLAVNRLSASLLIGVGGVMIASGYLIYSVSLSFAGAAAGFFILAFFMAFANTGVWTFYQDHVPVDIMGRVGSALGMVISIVQMAMVTAIGFAGDLLPIRPVIISGAGAMVFLALLLFAAAMKPSAEYKQAMGRLDQEVIK